MHEAAFMASEMNPMINRSLNNNSPINLPPGNPPTGEGPNGRLNGAEHHPHLLLEQNYPIHLHASHPHLHPLHQGSFGNNRFQALRHPINNNNNDASNSSSNNTNNNDNNINNNSLNSNNSNSNNNNNNANNTTPNNTGSLGAKPHDQHELW